MRKLEFETNHLENPYASVLITSGRTKVLVSVSLEKKAPPFVEEGEGWVTAEYSLLPASTDQRNRRERGKVGGRTMEIQRLIGRSLRMAVDRTLMPGLTLIVDADVLQADGGTRTASINGGMLALFIAGKKLFQEGLVSKNPVTRWIGAISSGIVDGEPIVDLDYEKDSNADSDFNFVFSESSEIIEIQGTAEQQPVSGDDFLNLMELSKNAVRTIVTQMKKLV